VDDRGAVALAIFAVLSVVILISLLLGSRSRATLPARLIGLGVLLALVAMWYGLLTGLPSRDHMPNPFGNPALAEGLLKLAAVLVLGGIVISLLVHDTASVNYVPPEHPRDVPPSL
jgi:hypothetical protein